MLKQMHRLQPAIDVTPDEEDVALIAAAPALANCVRDIANYVFSQSEGRYDLATLGFRTEARIAMLSIQLSQIPAMYQVKRVDLTLPIEEVSDDSTDKR